MNGRQEPLPRRNPRLNTGIAERSGKVTGVRLESIEEKVHWLPFGKGFHRCLPDQMFGVGAKRDFAEDVRERQNPDGDRCIGGPSENDIQIPDWGIGLENAAWPLWPLAIVLPSSTWVAQEVRFHRYLVTCRHH